MDIVRVSENEFVKSNSLNLKYLNQTKMLFEDPEYIILKSGKNPKTNRKIAKGSNTYLLAYNDILAKLDINPNNVAKFVELDIAEINKLIKNNTDDIELRKIYNTHIKTLLHEGYYEYNGIKYGSLNASQYNSYNPAIESRERINSAIRKAISSGRYI